MTLKELFFCIGGTTCVGMVVYGSGDGEAGPSMFAYNSFVADVLKTQPASVCCDISGLEVLGRFSSKFCHLCDLIGINVCLTDFGSGFR